MVTDETRGPGPLGADGCPGAYPVRPGRLECPHRRPAQHRGLPLIPAWLSFLAASQGAEPVIAIVREHARPVGYFVGAIVRRFGIRILGSPLKGWTTPYMGFLLDDNSCRPPAARALVRFAFTDLRCLHVELVDRKLSGEQMAGAGYSVETPPTFVIDLRGTEDEILPPDAGQDPAVCPQGRAARGPASRGRIGLRIRQQVLRQEPWSSRARQGLTPTYGAERVRQLIGCLQPAGQVLLLRVLDKNDRTSV